MAKSPEEMAAEMIANIGKKTGRSLEAWYPLIKESGKEKPREVLNWLKSEHEITHGYANLISLKYKEMLAGGPVSKDDLVEAQYSGAKAALRPIYDALIEIVQGLGADVEIAPKKAYVSIRRKKQFAIFQPSTKTRFDLGLNLKGVAPSGRLEASGSFNAMVSHRVRIADVSEVDADLVSWLKTAYEAS